MIRLYLLPVILGILWTSWYFVCSKDAEARFLRRLAAICYFYPWILFIVMLFPASGRAVGYYESTMSASVLREWPLDAFDIVEVVIQEFVAAMMLWNSLLVGLIVYVYLVFLCRKRLILLAMKGQAGWIR